MANEYIARLSALGFGKETTAGTQVPATVWIPRDTGSAIIPSTESAQDNSAQGSIVDINDEKVVKEWSEINAGGSMNDGVMGVIYNALLGTYVNCEVCSITGASGGTPAVADTITSASGSWGGTLKKSWVVGSTTYWAIEVTSGTLSAQTDVTNGTWTGGTSVIATGVHAHYFTIDQTSNNHPTYSAWENAPAGNSAATYSMLNSFELDCAVGNFVKFSSQFLAQKATSEGATATVAYADDNLFLFSDGNAYFADDIAGLESATAVNMSRFGLNVAKNLNTDAGRTLGSTSISAIFNQNFNFGGSIEALFSDQVLKGYVTDGTQKSARLALINNRVDPIFDATDDIYPSIITDIHKVAFSEFTQSDDLNTITTQTINFSGLKSSSTMEVLLVNTDATGY